MAFNRSPPGSKVQGLTAAVTGQPKAFKCNVVPNVCSNSPLYGAEKESIRDAQMALKSQSAEQVLQVELFFE